MRKSFVSSNRENVVQKMIRHKKEESRKTAEIYERRKKIQENIEDIDATRSIEDELDQTLSDQDTATDQENQEAFDELFGDDDTPEPNQQ